VKISEGEREEMATGVVVLEHGEIGESVMKQQSKGHDECCKTGPGYTSPLDAMSTPKETLIYVTAIYSGTEFSYIQHRNIIW
jgi:selenium-binding protein 1